MLTDDGEAAGDAAIVAVPLAVLRRLPFSPPVPGACQRAWQRAGLAHNAKLHVPLTRPAAPSAVQSVPGKFWTWTAADATGQVQPVLHSFGGTEPGLAALTGPGGGATWASRAAALRPELGLDVTRALLTTWNDDPWAGESYSALTVAVAGGDDGTPGCAGWPGPHRRRAQRRGLGRPDGRSAAVGRARGPGGARRGGLISSRRGS